MPATVEPVGPVWVSAAGTVVGAWRCSTTVLLPVWKTPAASRISTTAAPTRGVGGRPACAGPLGRAPHPANRGLPPGAGGRAQRGAEPRRGRAERGAARQHQRDPPPAALPPALRGAGGPDGPLLRPSRARVVTADGRARRTPTAGLGERGRKRRGGIGRHPADPRIPHLDPREGGDVAPPGVLRR